MAAESVEVRLARLEGSYEQINERLGSIEARITSLEQKVDRQFYWLTGILVTSLAGLATSLLVLLIRV